MLSYGQMNQRNRVCERLDCGQVPRRSVFTATVNRVHGGSVMKKLLTACAVAGLSAAVFGDVTSANVVG